ncbi:hypothetical protein [Nocardioides speluncae]|uniref:hypothetical protein n=1 Tax=Nocardioides speluncae TaxID=2670337 RepID=UPI0012B169E7|nr:hypothetical protein [Nocardioides speluncae]
MVQTVHTPAETVRGAGLWEPAVLIGAPAVAVVARLLTTPWYQDDADQPDSARVLADIADAPVRNDVGMLLGLVAALLFAGAAVAVGLRVREQMPRLGTAGMLMAVIGGFGLAMFSDLLLLAAQAADVEGERAAMAELFDQAYSAPLGNFFFLLLIVGAVGWVLLSVGLYRKRIGSRAAAVLAGLGGAAVMLTAPGPAISFIAGAAVISLVGLTWVGAGLHRSR